MLLLAVCNAGRALPAEGAVFMLVVQIMLLHVTDGLPQECKALGVFSQLQALEYLGGKLTQRGNRAFERRRKSKVRR
jgi:hypothetical protein